MKSFRTTCFFVLAFTASFIFPIGMMSFMAADGAFRDIVVIDDGQEITIRTASSTVEYMLNEHGITLHPLDIISPPQSSVLFEGIQPEIFRARTFTYSVDGVEGTYTVRHGRTVEAILLQKQRALDTAIIYSGDFARQITHGDYIPLLTWRTSFYYVSHPLPYSTYRNITNRVSAGREILRVTGEYGEKISTYLDLYIGGEFVSREYISTATTRDYIQAILDIGTGWLGALTDVTAADFHYYRRLRMEATAYTAGYCCTNKHPWDPWYRITASGREVEHGIVAVDRNVIPLGTRLYVENYGFAIAADVGGAIRGYKIDLFMEELADARQFGRRNIYVWVLDNIWGDD